MRDRILTALRHRAANDRHMSARWDTLRERVGDVQISTIDAFCFSLLREFPLEAQVDPAFEIADETEMARFGKEALDLTLRKVRGVMAADDNVRLLFARVKLGPLRDAIQSLLDRRQLAVPAVGSFVARRVRFRNATEASAAFLRELAALLAASPLTPALIADGPDAPEFRWLRDDIVALPSLAAEEGRPRAAVAAAAAALS